MDEETTVNKNKGIQISFWTLLMVIAFALIGVALAKVVQRYDGSSDYLSQIYGSTQVQIDAVAHYQLKHDMFVYGVTGAGFGLLLGVVADGFRSLNRN